MEDNQLPYLGHENLLAQSRYYLQVARERLEEIDRLSAKVIALQFELGKAENRIKELEAIKG